MVGSLHMIEAKVAERFVDQMTAYRSRTSYGKHGFEHNIHYVGESYRDFLWYWDIPQGARVLDVATGRGEAADFLRDLFGARAVRTDLAKFPLYLQRSWVEELVGRNKLLAAAKATEQPFPEGTFDAIHIKDALVHIENKYKLFAEMDRLLVPGGKLLIVSQQQVYNCIHLFHPAYGSGKALPSRMVTFWNIEEYVDIVNQITQDDMMYEGKKYAAISPPYFSAMWGSLPFIAEQFHLIECRDSYVGCKGWTPPEDEKDWNHSERRSVEFVKN